MADYERSSGASSPRPRRRKRRSRVRTVLGALGKILGTLLLVGICTGALLACFAVVYVKTVIIPKADLVLTSFDLSQSSTMYYTDKRTGAQVEMLTLHGAENRVWVEYQDIPENLINATIAIEDKRFNTHQGVDWIRTAYGMLSMFTGRDIQGGSTITQQLIKNLTQEDEVTVKRKILEIFRALEFEKNNSKADILEWYLNYIYLGEGCNGVYTAALNYYGKEVQDLTLAECASIIAITNNPSLYNPYRYPDNNLTRRNLCLKLMCEQGMITEAERDAAIAEPLNLNRAEGADKEQEIFTWYEDQVINDVITDLRDRYDMSKEAATTMIYSGGLRIETCYDPEVQAYVDAIYRDRSSLVLDSKTGQEIQSAITVIDNSTGNVVALAGGLGEKTSSRIFNRATTTVRPPGSSIKPIAVYAPALDMGMITPATVFDDTPIELNGSAWPVNSYGYFKGLCTVREALEDSVNTVAVRVLRDCVSPPVSYQYLTENFGITSLIAAKEINGQVKTDIDLAPLALGGLTEGVSTYEMAAAYATFANNGVYRTPRTYLRVTAVDINGRETVLLDNTAASDSVLRTSTVYYINAMLQNVVSNGTGTDAKFANMTIAGKTGTTSSRNDLWFAGYTPYYTAAVWVGYDQQERIESNGAALAARMWKKVMEPMHANLENRSFVQPDNLVEQYYCLDSGMIANDWCPKDPRGNRVVKGTFINGDQPKEYCTVHVPVEVCTESPILDANGSPNGGYHLAGEFCPEESRSTAVVLDFNRERASANVRARDDAYLKSTLEGLENGGLCPLHTSAVEPPVPEFDPFDPTTWPNDPNFDPTDPTTWPGYDPNGTDPPVTDPDPGTILPPVTSPPPPAPSVEPTPPVDPSPDPSPPEPSPSDTAVISPPEDPLPDDPYVPADNSSG